MAIHRFVVVASLPATFPTLGRVRPNMTEQAALTRVNLGQQTLYEVSMEVSMGGSPLSGLVGVLAKARQVLDLTRNNNAEDLLHQRRVLTWRAKIGSTSPLCVCGARAQSARGLLVPRRHLYFSAG